MRPSSSPWPFSPPFSPSFLPWGRDGGTVGFDPFRVTAFTPVGGGEVARTVLDAQVRLTQALMTAAWTAQFDFLRAAASAVQEAQGRVMGGLMGGFPR